MRAGRTDKAKHSAARDVGSCRYKGISDHFAKVKKIAVAVHGEKPGEMRIPGFSEKHGICGF